MTVVVVEVLVSRGGQVFDMTRGLCCYALERNAFVLGFLGVLEPWMKAVEMEASGGYWTVVGHEEEKEAHLWEDASCHHYRERADQGTYLLQVSQLPGLVESHRLLLR